MLALLRVPVCQIKVAAGQLRTDEFRMERAQREFTSLEFLKAFEGPAQLEYRLGAGDEITVEVWDRSEVSGKHTIGPDGAITIPLAGPVALEGLSREAAAHAIRRVLAPFYTTELGVSVSVDRYAANRIFVLGRVATPGVLSFETPPTLIEAVTRAGALAAAGASDRAGLTRVAVFRGHDRVVWVDLNKVLSEGNLAYNIRLQRNDLVYIPDASDRTVYVLGEVGKPGAYGITPHMALIDAVSLAGGPNPDANTKNIQIIRPSAGLQTSISLQSLIAPRGEADFALHEGDIVYVPQRGLAKLGYTLQKLSPFTGLLVFSTAFAGR